MTNLFEQHKYNYTIPTDLINRLKKRNAELTLEVGRLQELVDLMTEQAEELRYEMARLEDRGDLYESAP